MMMKISSLALLLVTSRECMNTTQKQMNEYYLEVLKRLHECVRRRRPEFWKNNSWILRHDNATSHSACVLRETR